MWKRFAIVVSTAGLLVSVGCGQTDPGITSAVKTKLAADDVVKAYQIDVDTTDKVVTLTGAVDTSAAKDQAVVLARQTDGVRDVVDHLTVDARADVGNTVDGAGREIRDEAREATDAAKEAGRDVTTAAGDAANRTGGVLTDAAVTTSVKTKFLADTAVSGLKIDVDTKDGVVTLSGMVPTKAEIDRAVAMARETDGVKSVVNKLAIGH